jgi:hypothetical protein
MRQFLLGPAPEHQTDLRKAQIYYLESMQRPDGTNRLGTWLARSPANALWHGVQADVPTGEGPDIKGFAACSKMLGITPFLLDLVTTLPHDKYENIKHTTFVYAACGRAALTGNAFGPPHPMPGISLGLFPIHELPLDHMHPSDALWLPQELEAIAKEGPGEFATRYGLADAMGRHY